MGQHRGQLIAKFCIRDWQIENRSDRAVTAFTRGCYKGSTKICQCPKTADRRTGIFRFNLVVAAIILLPTENTAESAKLTLHRDIRRRTQYT